MEHVNFFKLMTKRPDTIQEFLKTEVPFEVIDGLSKTYKLSDEESARIAQLAAYVLVGVKPTEQVNDYINEYIKKDETTVIAIKNEFKNRFVDPFGDDLSETMDDVEDFAKEQKLPNKFVFYSLAPDKSSNAVKIDKSKSQVRNTSDIHPVPKKILKAPPPPASGSPKASVKSEVKVEAKPVVAPVTLKLQKLSDLENISPRALDHEAQDESNLVDRLKTEIQNIANASGAKRADIATSWKKSKLYKAYVNTGNESMQQNKSVAEVAIFNKTAGKPYLTEPQFNAISEVSRLLLR